MNPGARLRPSLLPLAPFDQADRKGYDVTQSTMRDHIRLIDGERNLAEFSYAVVQRYLEELPDRKK